MHETILFDQPRMQNSYKQLPSLMPCSYIHSIMPSYAGISTGVGWDTSLDLRFIISKQTPEAADETAKAKVDHILVPWVAIFKNDSNILWVVVSNMFYVFPVFGVSDSYLDEHMFERGWIK